MRNLIVKKLKIIKLVKELSRKIDSIKTEKYTLSSEIEYENYKIKSLTSERDRVTPDAGVHASEYLMNSFNYKLKLTEDISLLQTSVKKKSRKVQKMNKEMLSLVSKKMSSEKLIERLDKKISLLEAKREQQDMEQLTINQMYNQ